MDMQPAITSEDRYPKARAWRTSVAGLQERSETATPGLGKI